MSHRSWPEHCPDNMKTGLSHAGLPCTDPKQLLKGRRDGRVKLDFIISAPTRSSRAQPSLFQGGAPSLNSAKSWTGQMFLFKARISMHRKKALVVCRCLCFRRYVSDLWISSSSTHYRMVNLRSLKFDISFNNNVHRL